MNAADGSGPVDRDVGRFVGVVSAAIAAQRLMDNAALLSDLAMDAAVAGRGDSANTIGLEAARMRREAELLIDPYLTPNAEVSGGRSPSA